MLRSAVELLGKIGNEDAFPRLINTLKDPDLSVRWRATGALGRIGNEKNVPLLIKNLEDEKFILANQGSTFDFSIEAIESIQGRCQRYNFKSTGAIPSPKPQPAILRVPPVANSLMYLLHISDLHFTTPNQVSLWSNQLASDLRNDLQIPHLNTLILSGDIANLSTPDEYTAAQQFLTNLQQEFQLKPEQIIIVPGNHDLNWKLAKKAYQLVDRDDYDGELLEGHYIEESASVVRVRDEEKYKQRFAHFSQFYEAVKGYPYPLDYDRQYTLDHLPDQNLLILGLNSAWNLDHHYRDRASIHMDALSNALTKIRRNSDQYQTCLKIAVWHHPLDSPWNDRITDQSFLEQLAVAGFRLFLHGHIHTAETSLYRYDMSANGRKLDRICAGTFGAPTRELIPAYPWQYNLLTLQGDCLTVYTRRREAENGAWKPDARWSQGPGQLPLDTYTIEL